MARKRKTVEPLRSIDHRDLEWVVGGRIAVSKGPNPDVLLGLKSLTESVAQAGQVMQAKQQEKSGMMQQVMQKMMAGRG